MHPGVYVIHNGAPRPQSVVLALQDTLDWQVLQPEGIRIVSTGPTKDGYLRVGVMGDVATAQARLDAPYGLDLIRVHADTFGMPLPGRVRVDRPARI
jgi:hypothetical protein